MNAHHTRRGSVIDRLERRCLLAAVLWDGGGDGVHWSDRFNWSSDAVPGQHDDVTISGCASNPIVVDVSTTIASLQSAKELHITEAPILANGDVTLNAVVRVDGGGSLGVAGAFTFNAPLVLGDAVTMTLGTLFIYGSSSKTLLGTGAIEIQYGEVINSTYNPVTGSGLDLAIPSTHSVTTSGYAVLSSGLDGGRIINATTVDVASDYPFPHVWLGTPNRPFINEGTINISGSVGVICTNFVNNPNRTVNLRDTSTLQLLDYEGSLYSWDNNGTISLVDDATLYLGGRFVPGDLGTITRTEATTVSLVGTLDNTGGTFTFDGRRGTWNFAGGTIVGGIITRTGVNTLSILSGTLDGVTVNMPLDVINGGALYARDLTLNDQLRLGDQETLTSGDLYIVGSTHQTIQGTGGILIDHMGSVINTAFDSVTSEGLDLTIAASLAWTISGQVSVYAVYTDGRVINNTTLLISASASGYRGVQLGAYGSSFVNNGTIQLDDGVNLTAVNFINTTGSALVAINASTIELLDDGEFGVRSWDNDGVINLSSNAMLRLFGFFREEDIGTLNRDATTTLQIGGTLDNTGRTWVLRNRTQSAVLAGGTIRGGTIQPSPTATLSIASGILEGVRLQRVVTVEGSVSIMGNLVLDQARIDLGTSGGVPAQMWFVGSDAQSLLGTGDIVSLAPGSAIYNMIYDNLTATPGELTLGGGVRISGTGLSILGIYPTSTLTSHASLLLNGGGQWQLGSPETGGFRNFGAVSVSNATTAYAAFVGDVHSLMLDGPGTWMFVYPGSYRLNQEVRVLNNATLALHQGWSLGADMDIGGLVIFDYVFGQPVPTMLRTKILSGFAGGSWSGPGLRSSASAADPRTALGYASSAELFAEGFGWLEGFWMDEDAFAVRHTFRGDVNLDRWVEFSDLLRVAQNYGQFAMWAGGDFDYDGVCGFSDLLGLAQNYGTTPLRPTRAGLFSQLRIDDPPASTGTE